MFLVCRGVAKNVLKFRLVEDLATEGAFGADGLEDLNDFGPGEEGAVVEVADGLEGGSEQIFDGGAGDGDGGNGAVLIEGEGAIWVGGDGDHGVFLTRRG